jgi:hypothetical protein
VTLPRPASMSVDAVKEAHTAFNHVVGWRDEPSLAWLCFALRMAHRHKKYKTAALRMLARVATTGTHVGGRTPGSVLARLKQVAREVALTLTPLLLRYDILLTHLRPSIKVHFASSEQACEPRWLGLGDWGLRRGY